MTKPGFEYIDFVQPVQASQKNINKFNELDNLLTTGGFIQACNLPMATKLHGCVHNCADRREPSTVALHHQLSSIPSLPAPISQVRFFNDKHYERRHRNPTRTRSALPIY